MHHGAETDGTNGLEWGLVILKDLVAEFPIAVLQASPNILEAVCPEPVLVLVFPIMACPMRSVYGPRQSAPP